jgi:hypothetical protein
MINQLLQGTMSFQGAGQKPGLEIWRIEVPLTTKYYFIFNTNSVWTLFFMNASFQCTNLIILILISIRTKTKKD